MGRAFASCVYTWLDVACVGSLRKRTLEERKNTGGDCVLLPAKHRESDEETEVERTGQETTL